MSDKNQQDVNQEASAEEVSSPENAEEVLPDIEVIEEVSAEEESLKDQFVRLQADFTNFRNRTQRERVELYQRANEDLLLEILPVLDHFEMGLKTAKQLEAETSVLEGFELVFDQFQQVLDRFKLVPIDAVGEQFDPHSHEALTHLPSAEYAEGICIEQVRRGYRFGDKLLRAAQVVVSSGNTETDEA